MAAFVTDATIVTGTDGNDNLAGTAGSDAFIINNAVESGTDTINFGKNDSLLTTVKLYDSNNDGYINYGKDKRLDVYGSADTANEINMVGTVANQGVRYLGTADGYYVYADAMTKLQYFAAANAKEGTVGNDAFDATGAAGKSFFFDTALGLNLGNDTISGFGAGDAIITTSKIYDSNNDGVIHFGENGILDLPGGGTLDFGDPSLVLELVGGGPSASIGGVSYYIYQIDMP